MRKPVTLFILTLNDKLYKTSVLDLCAYVALAALLEFAVDPQDEADRKEGRLAVIADHLGFSWSGMGLF